VGNDHVAYLKDNTHLFARNVVQSIEDMVGCSFELSEESYCEKAFTPAYGMTVSIHFAGKVQGDYVVVMSEQTAAAAIDAYEDGMELDDLKPMREDYAGFIKECLNLSVGESIPALEASFGEITFSPPVVVFGEIEYPSVTNGVIMLYHEVKGAIQCAFSVNMANNKIGQRLDESLADLERKTAEAQAANRNIETMLRLLPNGLISIDSQSTVLPGYSEATARVVGNVNQVVQGEKVADVLGVSGAIREDVVSWVDLVFDKFDMLPFKDLVDLCPINEFSNDLGRILAISWFPVESEDRRMLERLFLVVEDVTHQRELEARAAELRLTHEENLELISQVMNLEPDEVTSFVYDSSSLLADARKVVEGDSHDRQFVTELFRTFHTLKSSSGQFNFKGLQSLAHHIESHLKAIGEAGEDTLTDHDVEELEHSISNAADYIDRLQQMQLKLGGRDETLVEKAERNQATVMVNLSKINELENLLGNYQLVARSHLDRYQLAQLGEIEQGVKSLRMINLNFFKSSLESLAQNSAEKLGKRVKLSINRDTEVDVSKLRMVHKTLVHMVNNAIDHGIESPEVRKAAGKFEEGFIVVNAMRESSTITVTIEDDGMGIDTELVRTKLVEKHGKTDEEVQQMSDSVVHSHLFISGFSTKDEVTMLSGRGVGMDYVYDTVVEKLKGKIDVSTVKGKGTKISIIFQD